MNLKSLSLKLAAVVVAVTGVILIANASSTSDVKHEDLVARGKYIVDSVGCADCHTPLVMGAKGPERDPTRHLSGHPDNLLMPPAPVLPEGPWQFVASGTMTAWNGPWGTSFTANLTPDKETGLGTWTVDQFIATIRNQRHQGRGRELLPPMPAIIYANFTDDDLRAIFAYLQSIPAVKNRVPLPRPPAEVR
jgi:mono/diheme cytochrome c family protein